MACKLPYINPYPPSAAQSAASPEVIEATKALVLNNDQLKEFMKQLRISVERGLSKKQHDRAIVKCFVTYVQNLPDGTEKGNFLGLDLGGTHFRVLLVTLSGKSYSSKVKSYDTPQELLTAHGDALFDYIAECMFDFMSENRIVHLALPLGFTFSFPLQQLGLTKGILVRWTKGFDLEDVVGKDVVQLLQDALNRRGDIQVAVTAVLNDTTGTLMSAALNNPNCKIGLIVGTGSNACYMEKQSNAELFDEPDTGTGHVIINTEFGAFGDDGCINFIVTEYDKEVDSNTINPGQQINEKLISGMYLGELVRVVALKLTNQGLMFGGQASEKLQTKDSFTTEHLSNVETDPHGTYTSCKKILKELGLGNATDKDLANFRFICECISRRSAHCVSASIATLIEKIDEPVCVVAVDGAVYRYHPHFHSLMKQKIWELVSCKHKFDVVMAEDGSGRGAAIVASVAAKYVGATIMSTLKLDNEA